MVKSITFAELRALCPDGYGGLTCEQYQKLFTHWDLDKEVHERDYFKLLCILTDTPFREVNPTPEKEAAIYELTRWVNEQEFPYSKQVPKTITISDVPVEVPDDLGELSIGQNIVLRQTAEKCHYPDEALSMATAICLQPLVDHGRFDYARAKELEKVVRKMKASEIYPIGFFFLSRVKKSGWKRSSFLLRTRNNLAAKFARTWRTWLKSPGSMRSQIST